MLSSFMVILLWFVYFLIVHSSCKICESYVLIIIDIISLIPWIYQLYELPEKHLKKKNKLVSSRLHIPTIITLSFSLMNIKGDLSMWKELQFVTQEMSLSGNYISFH